MNITLSPALTEHSPATDLFLFGVNPQTEYVSLTSIGYLHAQILSQGDDAYMAFIQMSAGIPIMVMSLYCKTWQMDG